MKKWICVLGGFLCYMLCMFPVRADTIWEPQDSFYGSHSSECEYEGRAYTANGPDGVVFLYASPVSARKVATWENGFNAYISFTYTDKKGTLWGVYEDGDESGWMPMEYMDVIYDHISFTEEYEAEIRQQDGTLDEEYLGKNIYLWNYPAAPEPFSMTITGRLPEYYQTYTDSEGHIWGNVGYYYGIKNAWICLDMPDKEMDTLYPGGSPGIGESRSAEKDFTGERITPGSESMVVAVVMVVLLVVLVTGLLLLALKRRGGGELSGKGAC